ncbi:ATP-binding protein [Aquabacterium sp. CECT 9606]|uniref:hybrid sensor histidine kinase/response regulator n=1 Tax=Aquabacterium sp. CECT 9606 TaxID=2845822 RepID=UPI001E51746B|nr:ATP-binding protein [Aquabacterium sp. CECT 9606]CAH0354259.1 Sensor histidine kinase RcsC [Aquabacterium sp. CECT 9606]
MSVARQKIFRIRRDYNSWVANETLEDYALRYTPRTFRKWSEFRVANTAFGAVSFLALEAIGGAIALNYGFSNMLWATLVVGLIIFMTGLPISYYAAKYGVDLDLLTRGAGFGYLGSTLTSLIYASFTFIFFALEAAIMALALQMVFDWSLPVCYLASSLVIVPLVTHGITLISRLQLWTQPLWALMFVCPFVFVAIKRPEAYVEFTGMVGRSSGSSDFNLMAFGMAATVVFSLIVQVGEQVDFLRFLPEKTKENRVRWWTAVLVAGPGWIVPGMLKMVGGGFLAFLALQHNVPADKAMEPTQMYLAGFGEVFTSPTWALGTMVLFVIVSQVKINVTNAYAGSLAWSNFFARLTHSHPGRVVWLVFNVLIAVMLMTLGVFGALERVLGLYGNVAIGWVGALVADLVINKPLGWSPKHIEFKRAYLYDLNPVGLGATLLATVMAFAAHAGMFGALAQAGSPFIALTTALIASPLLAWTTQGRYYLARPNKTPWAPGQMVACSVCENQFESEDMATCPAYDAPICSLCCTLESRCHDRCKSRSRAAEQVSDALTAVLPLQLSSRINFRVGHYLVVFLSLAAVLAMVLGVVYYQEGVVNHVVDAVNGPAVAMLEGPFIKAYALLLLAAAVCSWWVVLASESRRLAQDESNRHNQLLQLEIDAHRRTDAALQAAKDLAEAANQAKTRYVAGMTHELRTPLNSIMGYAQILLKDEPRQGSGREALNTIQRSGEHLMGLIDGLLDLARIEAGRLRLDPVPLPLREFLDDVVRMVQTQTQAKGLDFALETRGRVPAWVYADAKRLRQILLNLLSNAARFTYKGRITLLVDARREVLRFEVIDTGIGIAPQDLDRIFLPFERGSAGRRSSEPGTGLGLTITHLLTELMGGELSVKSELGQGSTFTVRMYLREIAEPAMPPQSALAARPRHLPITAYDGARRTLLVVDDQPIQRQMLAGMLLPLGFILREAASGLECLESVREACPDAVLLDITMDDVDGWQVARQIRAAGFTEVPIIMVSANVFENRPENLQAAQCQAFVAKPVIESELLDTLGEHLHIEWSAEPAALPLHLLGQRHNEAEAIGAPRLTASDLPLEVVEELCRLARIGHLRALREKLTQLAERYPQWQSEWVNLSHLADQFEFDTLIERLNPVISEDALDEPQA